jgi:hypothetical protein
MSNSNSEQTLNTTGKTLNKPSTRVDPSGQPFFPLPAQAGSPLKEICMDLMQRIGVKQSQYGFMRKVLLRLYKDGKIGKLRYGTYCSKSYAMKGN